MSDQSTKTTHVGRRQLLAGLAAVGASALVPNILRAAQGGPAAPVATPRLIDVHYHFSSPGFIAAIKARDTGQTALMNWTPAKALEDMDRDGVAASIVSTSEPSVWFGDDAAARALAREINEYGARLMADRPTRWGMFATLPLPDVDGALREIEYAFDTLNADGVCFMSSYQGKYLGDPEFAPVMDELNRRRAVCYTHPFRGESMINLLPGRQTLGITLVTETTLTIASVLAPPRVARTSVSSGRTAAERPYEPVRGRAGGAGSAGPGGDEGDSEVLLRHRASVQRIHTADLHQGGAQLAHPVRHGLSVQAGWRGGERARRLRVRGRGPARDRARERG